jgi:hypothetical protein
MKMRMVAQALSRANPPKAASPSSSCSPASHAQTDTEWRSAAGAWNDAEHWSAGLPRPDLEADIRGYSSMTVPVGTWVAGGLSFGTHQGDRARRGR